MIKILALFPLLFLPLVYVCAYAEARDNEIVFGQSASFTGSFSKQANAYRDGALLYFDEVNRRGGIHGRKIRLISRDDQYDPERALSNTRKFIEDDKVLALVLYTWTPIARAVIPVVTERRVPFFAPYTGANDVYRSGSPYVFTIRASFFAELEMIVRHLSTLGMHDVALVRYTSKTGDELQADLEALLKKYNGKLAGIGKMANNSANPAEAVRQLSAIDADALLLGVSGSDAVAFVQTFEAGGKRKFPYFARSLIGANQLASDLGKQATGITITQLVPNPFKKILPVVKEYNRLLLAKNPQASPDYIPLEGFIAAKVLCEALARSGPNPSRSRFVETLTNLGELDVGGFVVNFTPTNRNGSEYIGLTMIGRNGRPID